MTKRRSRSSRRRTEPTAQAAADVDPLTAPANAELEVNPFASELEPKLEPEEPPEGLTVFTEENPTDGVLHWHLPQQHRYFFRYEEGIWMTRNS
jgi:hypothetical protein